MFLSICKTAKALSISVLQLCHKHKLTFAQCKFVMCSLFLTRSKPNVGYFSRLTYFCQTVKLLVLPTSIGLLCGKLTSLLTQSVWRRATSFTAGVRFPAGTRDFSLLDSVHIVFGAHSIAFTSSFGPTQSPIQCLPGLLPQRYIGWGVMLTAHLHLVPRSRMMQLQLYSPIRLHGLVLNYLCTGGCFPGIKAAGTWSWPLNSI
jgi:hypothetical protein